MSMPVLREMIEFRDPMGNEVAEFGQEHLQRASRTIHPITISVVGDEGDDDHYSSGEINFSSRRQSYRSASVRHISC